MKFIHLKKEFNLRRHWNYILLYLYISKAGERIEDGCLFSSCLKSFVSICTLCVFMSPFQQKAPVVELLFVLICFSSNSCIFSVYHLFWLFFFTNESYITNFKKGDQVCPILVFLKAVLCVS